MQLNELRTELEHLAATGATAEQISQLSQEWEALKPSTPTSYHAVIDDRLQQLRGGSPRQAITAELCDSTGSISAVELGDIPNRREVIAPRDEAANFMADCDGWLYTIGSRQQIDRFHEGYSVVLSMSAENWQLWLDAYEVCDLDSDLANSLTA